MSNAATQYPTLTEMGITRFTEISQYSLYLEGASTDVLRIYYRRAKGSLLPTTRKYKFGRAVKAVRTDDASGQMKDIHEISPFVLKAVAELDAILKTKKVTIDTKAQLLTELNHMEDEFNARFAELKAIVDKL